jgi:hypothetical protein
MPMLHGAHRQAVTLLMAATLITLLPAPSYAAGTVSGPCDANAGTRFNLEPRDNPQPQNGTSVDFLPGAGTDSGDLVVGVANDMRSLTAGAATAPDFRGVFGVSSQTGFYVHRSGSSANPCAPDFEGGFGSMVNPSNGHSMIGVGYPAVVAHSGTKAFFAVDTRTGNGENLDSAVGLFRTTAATLDNFTACPDGTLTEAQSATCWPVRTMVGLTSANVTTSSPHLAVDDRAGSAGDVYVVSTRISNLGSFISLVACKNSLAACSQPIGVSGSDAADLAQVAVRPDGGVTVTYTVYSGGAIGNAAAAVIKYAACTPNNAPAAPTCAPAVVVTNETQAIPFNAFDPRTGFGASQFVMHTFPKLAHRQDTNGIETYVVWERCKVSTKVVYPGLNLVSVCPDSDLMMAASADNGQTWHTAPLDTSPQDQFQASLAVDPATNAVNIAYYSSAADPLQHKFQVLLRQVPPGPATPDAAGVPVIVTAKAIEPAGDPVLQGIFIGHYFGLAARGNRAYVHFMSTSFNGSYNGASAPEQNNHLSQVDF